MLDDGLAYGFLWPHLADAAFRRLKTTLAGTGLAAYHLFHEGTHVVVVVPMREGTNAGDRILQAVARTCRGGWRYEMPRSVAEALTSRRNRPGFHVNVIQQPMV
jgi:hypothetical protein